MIGCSLIEGSFDSFRIKLPPQNKDSEIHDRLHDAESHTWLCQLRLCCAHLLYGMNLADMFWGSSILTDQVALVTRLNHYAKNLPGASWHRGI